MTHTRACRTMTDMRVRRALRRSELCLFHRQSDLSFKGDRLAMGGISEKGYDQGKGWGVMESPTRCDFSSKMSHAEHPPYSLSQAFLDRDSYNSHVHLQYEDKHLTITKSHALTR